MLTYFQVFFFCFFFQKGAPTLRSFHNCFFQNFIHETSFICSKKHISYSDKQDHETIRFSLLYNTSARHERHECDTNYTSATRVRHERYECDTSVTRVLLKRHECDTIATQINHMTKERFQGEEQFYSKNYLLEMSRSHAKMHIQKCATKTELCNGKSYIKNLYTRL